MRIFFITYWGVKDGLSASTVFPNLQTLSTFDAVKHIDYFTVERAADELFKDSLPPIPKVTHIPIVSKNYGFFLLTKIADWQRIRSTILQKAKTLKPDLVICRGAMAGAFGTLLYKRLGIPFVVESFEPHSAYMLESGVWKKNSLRYRFQVQTEAEIKKNAAFLVTVSHNYHRHLNEKEGIPASKLKMVPCMVNADAFSFDAAARAKKRQELNIPEDVKVGIYLGKFGSIYYDEEAFRLFKAAHDFFKGKFFLLLLSPTPLEELKQKLQAVDFPFEKIWIGTAPHQEVPQYLSAADFAFSTIKPADCRRFCSPIKDGEYWANGLPILLPDGVGDDSDIIKQEGGGAIIDVHDAQNIEKAFKWLDKTMQEPEHRAQIREIAVKHRNFQIGQSVYKELIQYFSGAKR